MPLIKPREVKFSPENMDRLWDYVDKQIDYLLQESDSFRNNTLPEWTRLLKGVPDSETKNFPFENASNLVVQLIATRVEQLLSRVMIIYSVDPLWSVAATGDVIGQEADAQAKVLEQFMGDQAIDPSELALYRKEEIMFHNGIAYGTAFMGFPMQYIEEACAADLTGEGAELVRPSEFPTYIRKDGPSPENVPLHRVLISNKVTDLEKARFFAREIPLTREQVEDRIAFGIWSEEEGKKVLANPNPKGQSYHRTVINDSKHIDETGNEYGNEYLVYECYFKFVHDRTMFSIKADYCRESKGRLNCVFNYNPKNALPYEDLRFGYDDDSFLGYGFIEMLKSYQQEVSQIHNNRLDNETIRNTAAFRIDPDSELASSIKLYPGVGIPEKEGGIEILNLAPGGAMDNMASEQASIAGTNERAGIDPAISGNGGGVVNSKRGIYSSQGTMAVLQQQNNRTGLRMMDIRGTHVKIGRKLLDLYANIGIGKRVRRYGEQAELLQQALKNVKDGNIGLILKASSASTNVESDRQNSILLAGLQEKYVGTVNQLMQAMKQPQIADDPVAMKFIQDTMQAEQSLTRHIFRIFGHADVDKLIPFPEAIKNARRSQQPQAQAQNVVPSFNNSAANSVPGSSSPQQAGGVS